MTDEVTTVSEIDPRAAYIKPADEADSMKSCSWPSCDCVALPGEQCPSKPVKSSVSELVERITKHEDRIQKLDRVFYVRWTSGPDYERAFLCVEDGEPDMRDFATVSFGQAALFVAAFEASQQVAASALADAERERDAAWTANERDRSIVIDARNAISDAIKRRSWLLTSRGSYEWDDDRYRHEFRQALEEIEKPLEILEKIGVNWQDCPKDSSSIQSARIDWKSRAESAEAKLAEAVKVMEPFSHVAENDIGEDETDGDLFKPMSRYNHVPRLTVGDLRAAARLIASMKGDDA